MAFTLRSYIDRVLTTFLTFRLDDTWIAATTTSRFPSCFPPHFHSHDLASILLAYLRVMTMLERGVWQKRKPRGRGIRATTGWLVVCPSPDFGPVRVSHVALASSANAAMSSAMKYVPFHVYTNWSEEDIYLTRPGSSSMRALCKGPAALCLRASVFAASP